ncbi:Trk system potassium transporter TrkA [Rubrivirga sp. S365]|uniref:Trk system potassium uptake protein TrkA n=1 Tax=Rubrivirga litoralis TaxID=3075598 RepID=A0ABU3BU47_9BACT|nr:MULTISPECIES: Trk system potassium transporter TrkA [unclassified Rubrivirga]MDT0632819.1 Trk system potassium transporter TrkA [Rubrivirga sp. F394]MDT7855097.1 Trk system potassium transporter TrkA [Rubrivirga sp. S365]
MRAIVVGAGDVGYDVARLLSLQRHDVTVIDTDADRVAAVRETLDVLAIVGSGTSATTLQEARIEDADLVVAVTDVDEVNIIASMLAERVGKPADLTTTIARVRSAEFTGSDSVLRLSDFGIDHLIHPEQSTANEVVSLLRRAAATDIIEFCGNRVQLVGIRIERDSPAAGLTLVDLARRSPLPFRVMGISRGVRTILPSGGATIQAGDQVFVLVETGRVAEAARVLGKEAGRLRHVMILGGTSVGARVAAGLSGRPRKGGGMEVKVVEADRARAQALAETLEGVLVIHGDPGDIDLLAREGLAETDALVAVTADEESNLVSCLMAKHLEVRKTVALLSKSAYIPISQSIGLDAAVSQKLAVSREVLRFLRGAHVRSVATVPGLDAEILELVADPGAPITRAPLAEQRLPSGVLIGAVVGKRVEIATGQTVVQPGARAVVFATPARVEEVEPLFSA